METTAQVEGDDIVLTGRKAVVINAEAADYLIVSARESGAAADAGASTAARAATAAGVAERARGAGAANAGAGLH